MYEKHGVVLTEGTESDAFRKKLVEQEYELKL